MTAEEGVTGSTWTESEVEAVVADHFQMLRMPRWPPWASRSSCACPPATRLWREDSDV